ncbi:15668_t:CDS:2, partial [Funneliformis caledonium]
KCNGIYVDSRTKNKHSINQNVATNTSVLLQNENDPMIELSQHSFINEESSIELQAEESSIELQATDTLIKFVKHVLMELDHNDQFKDFPTSLYTTRKKLGLKYQFITFSQKAIKRCDHIQFPNHHHHFLRKCNASLSEQKELEGGKIARFRKKLWTNRNVQEEILYDIYNGNIWKKFSNNGELYDIEELLNEQKFLIKNM